MARIDQILDQAGDEPVFSFEFFPPKTDEGMTNLFETASRLRELDPSFVSVTYGAGGSTRDRTIAILGRIKNELGIEAMAHFTCVGSTVEELRETLDAIVETGVENIIALRGDPPQGESTFTRTEGGLGNADELTTLIVENYDVCVAGACYPEVHPEAVSAEQDLAYAKLKVDNGAKFLVTQLFFDNDAYFDFVERAREAGIDVPIVPGIMPIGNFSQLSRFSEACGAEIPRWMRIKLEGYRDDAASIRAFGLDVVTDLCRSLLDGGAPGLHFYTLNQAALSAEIWKRLGL
jgi:methylenetetrahydrofolate reductase (NADPH)